MDVENLSDSSQGERSRERITLCLLLLATLILLFLRRPDAFLNPQFYAEDSTMVFRQHYELGFQSLLLSASGYLLTLQRLIGALIMTILPYSLVPLGFNLASVLITLAVVASVFSPRIPLNNKPLFALAIVLVPHHSNEVFNNLVCSQWIVAIILILLLIKESPDAKYGSVSKQYAMDIFQLVLFGLSGPFLLLFSPLYLCRAILQRDRYSFLLLGLTIGCCGIQVFYLLNSGMSSAPGDSARTFSVLKAIFGMKLFGNFLLGAEIPYKLPRTVLAAAYVAMMVLVLRISSHKGPAVYYFLAAHCAVILAALIKFRNVMEALVPPANGPRYFYIPYLMLTWGLLLGIDHKERWKSMFCRCSLGFVLLSAISINSHYEPYIDYKWKDYAPKIGKEDLEIPVNPKGWTVTLKARKQDETEAQDPPK